VSTLTPEPAPSPLAITSSSDLPDLRRWAFAELAAGRPREALDTLCELNVPEDLEPAWFDVLDEVTVRAGIALDEPELVVPVFLGRPPGELGGAGPAMLARGIGAQWLIEDAIGRDGPHLRFTALRGLVHASRWSLARALASGELTATQQEEGRAALDRFIAGSWREPDGQRALRLAERAPRRLRPRARGAAPPAP